MKAVVLILSVLSALGLMIATLANLPTKLVFNGSESAPIGFYWVDVQSVQRGDFVLIRVPERVRKLIVSRRYLPPSLPLLKQVFGVEGDTICRRDREILVDGITVAVAQNVDDAGRDMPVWHGCIRLNEQQIFLLQDHPRSFDSRYFGPVDRSLIVGRATKLWMFGSGDWES